MDAKYIRKIAKDGSVSDKIVLDILKNFLTDKKDAYGNIVAPTEKEMRDIENLSKFIIKQRPAVAAKLARYMIAQHKNDCCKP